MRNLCIIFPDQLNPDISSLLEYDKELDEILLCEFKKDFTNLNHHKKKNCLPTFMHEAFSI